MAVSQEKTWSTQDQLRSHSHNDVFQFHYTTIWLFMMVRVMWILIGCKLSSEINHPSLLPRHTATGMYNRESCIEGDCDPIHHCTPLKQMNETPAPPFHCSLKVAWVLQDLWRKGYEVCVCCLFFGGGGRKNHSRRGNLLKLVTPTLHSQKHP